MAKVFAVSTPEELAALEMFVKDGAGLESLAKVWRMEKRKGGRVPWEGMVHVAFETVGRGRRAYVYRLKTPTNKRILADLKYAPALDWAKNNLVMVDAAL